MKKLKSRAGFSLLETLLAATLFMGFMLVLSLTFPKAIEWNADARRLTEARLRVVSAIETVMAEEIDSSKIVHGEYPSTVPGVEIKVEQDEEQANLYSVIAKSVEGDKAVVIETKVLAQLGGIG